ncbi:hypothetical protein AVEN_102235-1 [Araneus ventricosus]|uniref:Uncharacterized protein n=1 Tax=Araneus ventricosus TaxID=182803 RepID=A0A4Y2MCT5_ARAVE|nr:hypothetical protein AVEN_102235-1 [Araneus ventricosus]
MTAAAIASNTEAGVLVANHLATARPLLKEVHTITGGGTQAPPLLYPHGKRFPVYLSGSKSYPCTRGAPRGRDKLPRLSVLQCNPQRYVRERIGLPKPEYPFSEGGSGGLVVRSELWGRRVLGAKPDFTEDPSCIGPIALLLHVKSNLGGQASSHWFGAEA